MKIFDLCRIYKSSFKTVTFFDCLVRHFYINNSTQYAQSKRSIRHLHTNGEILSSTHPHILKEKEIMPGIPVSDFFLRRSILSKSIPPNSAVIVAGNRIRYASGSVFYPFQQNTNLLYLCGFDEPESALFVTSKGTSILFCAKEAEENVDFHGTNVGPARAMEFFGVDDSKYASDLPNYVQNFLQENPMIKKIYHSGLVNDFTSTSASFTPKLLQVLDKISLFPVDALLEGQRSIKSINELHLMRKAAEAITFGFDEAFKGCKAGLSEHQLASLISHGAVYKGNATRLSYEPVVAGGSNALVLHYTKNRSLLKDNTLVLIDAGAEYSYYRSDVSRTIPVNGKYTAPQKELYGLILDTLKFCTKVDVILLFKMCQEQLRYSIQDIYTVSVYMLYEGLLKLGFSLSISDVVKDLYFHNIGHHLGLDLHDVPTFSQQKKLVTGNVITIEPGLYIPKDDKYPSRYHGIGIRLEDNIVVGWNSCEILTRNIPIEIEDIEQRMAR